MRRLREFSRDVDLFLIFNLFAFVGFGIFQVIFNLYLYQLGLHENYIGLFSAVQTIALAAGAIALGTLLHRFGTWRCVVAGLGLFLVVCFIQALMENQLVLLVLAAANGLAQALFVTSRMPCVIAWARAHQRQHVAAFAYSTVALALTIGSLLGGLLPALLHYPFPSIPPDSLAAYRWTLVAGTLIAAIGLVPLFLMGESRHERPAGRRAAPVEPLPPAVARQARRDMSAWILIGAVMGLGAGMLIPFFNVYLTTLGANSQQVGYVYALGGFGSALIGLGAPWLTQRQGALRSAFWLRLAPVPVFALLLVIPVLAIAIPAYLIRITMIYFAAPIESTFIAEVLPGRARIDVFGHRAGAWDVTSALTSIAAGWIIVRYGYSWSILGLIVFTTIAEILYLGYYRRQPRVRAGEIPSALPQPRRLEGVEGSSPPNSKYQPPFSETGQAQRLAPTEVEARTSVGAAPRGCRSAERPDNNPEASARETGHRAARSEDDSRTRETRRGPVLAQKDMAAAPAIWSGPRADPDGQCHNGRSGAS